ncbi:MAG: ATP-binding protein [Bacteroidales bacterium]|nr:ATP-binding protein [Bacteroidales bacterium]
MKTLDLHIIDIVHNSIRAGASVINIDIIDNDTENIFSVKITDNGCGMDKETLEAINESFYSSRKERKIGMGIALLKYHSELAEGEFRLTSELGKGTQIYGSFRKNHIDMQPLGDLSGTFANFICQYQDVEFKISYARNDEIFEISSSDVKEVFENINLNNFKIIQSLKTLIYSNITDEEE